RRSALQQRRAPQSVAPTRAALGSTPRRKMRRRGQRAPSGQARRRQTRIYPAHEISQQTRLRREKERRLLAVFAQRRSLESPHHGGATSRSPVVLTRALL